MSTSNLSVHQIILELAKSYIIMDRVPVEQLGELLNNINSQLKKFIKIENEETTGDHINTDHFNCLICGKKVIFLNKHLKKWHGIDLSNYKNQFNLSRTYPVVPKDYSVKRSKIAKESNLGKHRHPIK